MKWTKSKDPMRNRAPVLRLLHPPYTLKVHLEESSSLQLVFPQRLETQVEGIRATLSHSGNVSAGELSSMNVRLAEVQQENSKVVHLTSQFVFTFAPLSSFRGPV